MNGPEPYSVVWLVQSKVKLFADGLFFLSQFMLSFVSRLSSFILFPRDLSVTLTSMTLSSYGTDLRRWVPDRDPHTSLAVFLSTTVSACRHLLSFSCFTRSEYHSTTFWLFTLVSDIVLNIQYLYFI